jgi:TPR repeat protein
MRGEILKKAKFNWEAASMAGDEEARYNLGNLEAKFGNMERAAKHWTIAASAGNHYSLVNLLVLFKQDLVPRDEIESALTSYNNSCAEMRSEAREAYIRAIITDTI